MLVGNQPMLALLSFPIISQTLSPIMGKRRPGTAVSIRQKATSGYCPRSNQITPGKPGHKLEFAIVS
ncbi:MAG: hypothetical protein KC413_03130 [Anaerolineales bacterium]|nr:hypothetical protein [Anaerolineales bacterium]